MREAVIVAGARTAVGKAPKGTLRYVRPEDMGAAVIRNVLERVPQVQPEMIDDVIVGCSFPEGEQGFNMGRVLVLRAELPITVPGFTINRFCSSGLNAIALAAQQIMIGQADIILAGGVESMSMVPMGGNKIAPNPWLMEHMPAAYMGMGLTAENVAQRYGITREEQDRFALASHQKAAAAIREGRFKDEIVPLTVKQGKKEIIFDTDEGVRSDTSLEALAKLKPAFHAKGTVTAGNSSQTSDGAAFVMVMAREKAEELGLEPLAVFKAFAVGGVHPDEMGIGPVVAIPKALKIAGLTLDDIKVVELNEAFASQALYVIKKLELDPARVNPNGGAIALGHPLGCTGAKLTVSLINELRRRGGGYGIVSMCIGGGMGAAGIFEVLA
ncbi:acetyl-CoA C-acyltransferase [Carboxydocella sp. ULO1]|uniref:thiolase family protein n=1 Tax=Carboxydocella sp. ULO1 TaxID=1926599 RepID=UPI0009AD3923|nr:acetyl-CoA C-acyltransferase [Carboxydocella sp. ULO1]GAW28339.1 acetyl-CoA acetyltransferase [Carboxydocella sp. ULO1]